jgi:hypothetical protein
MAVNTCEILQRLPSRRSILLARFQSEMHWSLRTDLPGLYQIMSKEATERNALKSSLLRDLALTGELEYRRIGSTLGGERRLSSGEK